MKIFTGERRSGKTTRLIQELSKSGGGVFAVLNRSQVEDMNILAGYMEIHNIKFITYKQLIDSSKNGRWCEYRGKIAVDEIERFLKHAINPDIEMFTSDSENNERVDLDKDKIHIIESLKKARNVLQSQIDDLESKKINKPTSPWVVSLLEDEF